jgi:hypothetical protein
MRAYAAANITIHQNAVAQEVSEPALSPCNCGQIAESVFTMTLGFGS